MDGWIVKLKVAGYFHVIALGPSSELNSDVIHVLYIYDRPHLHYIALSLWPFYVIFLHFSRFRFFSSLTKHKLSRREWRCELSSEQQWDSGLPVEVMNHRQAGPRITCVCSFVVIIQTLPLEVDVRTFCVTSLCQHQQTTQVLISNSPLCYSLSRPKWDMYTGIRTAQTRHWLADWRGASRGYTPSLLTGKWLTVSVCLAGRHGPEWEKMCQNGDN